MINDAIDDDDEAETQCRSGGRYKVWLGWANAIGRCNGTRCPQSSFPDWGNPEYDSYLFDYYDQKTRIMILKYSPIVILNIINPFHDLNLFPADEPQIMVPKHPLLAILVLQQKKSSNYRPGQPGCT